MNRQLGRLSDSHVRLFLAIVLRNPNVFGQFQEQLTPMAFTDGGLRRVWQAALLRFETMGRAPEAPELLADIATAAIEAQNLDFAVDEECRIARDFVLWAYDPNTFLSTDPASLQMEEYAFQVGRTLLLRAQTESLLQALPQAELGSLPTLLERAQLQASAFASLDANPARQMVFSEGWDTSDPLVIRTTGFQFLDRFMGGGEAAGEAYMFFAPMGTCKTTFAVMKWVASGRQACARMYEPRNDGRIGLSILVSYEASIGSELRHRALSYAARIHKDRLQGMGTDGLRALSSDSANPLPYERTVFAQEIEDGLFLPERTRIEEQLGWMNQHLVCFDMSGSDKTMPHAGYGGVPEIVQRINGLLRGYGGQAYVESIVIDYLGLMVDRHLASLPVRERAEAHQAYQTAVNTAVKLIAKPFQCPVWFTHQLSGEANAVLNVTRQLHHTSAKGAKMAAENADFAFVVGNLNSDAMGVIDCSKHRRFRATPRAVIRVEGDFNNICALDNYSIDQRGRIVDRATLEAATGDRPARSSETRSALVTASPSADQDDWGDI